MRAYYWGNLYLSSIQQGIQSLHCTGELFLKYGHTPSTQHFDLWRWVEDYKTVIILNAGEQCSLQKVARLVDNEANPYAWATWSESEESLNGCLTSVGIILPERIYIGAREMKKYWRNWDNRRKLSPWEIEICELINSTYMAR